ncbi:MAG: hypothetical protein NTY44_03640 [Deltaproteobacteria bacterium]|nr:hypothetical protein [Deltaproteobacteria bacterium]
MVEDDISKLHIDKKSMAVRRGRKKRSLLLVVILLVGAGGGILYSMGLLTPALTVQVVGLQSIYPSQTFAVLNASGYVVAQRKSRGGLEDYRPADFLVCRGRKPGQNR